MKQVSLFIIIFCLGALAFALFDAFLAPKAEAPTQIATSTPEVVQEVRSTTTTETNTDAPAEEDEVVITDDGTLLDGPFVIFDAQGEQTDASVRQFISPEEQLIQFQNFDLEYSLASRVYFASDKQATDYLNLGPARMADDVLVYGIPLDADLSTFDYILIYDEQRGETEYYARIK